MTEAAPQPVTVIRPSRGWASLGLHEVWEYRELLYFLIWREIKARYRQMAIGPLWIVIIPIINMVVFSAISGVAGISHEGLPRPIFIYTALLPWQLFAESTKKSTTSLVSNLSVISKVYFPRLVVPLAAACVGVVDFCIAFSVLVVLMIAYGIAPTVMAFTLPLYMLLALASALAIGLWLAAIAVKFRDVGYGIGYLLQVVFFLCPVFYPAKLAAPWDKIYRLNPMANVVEGFRWALTGVGSPHLDMTLISAAIVAVLLVSGLYVFRRVERTIVDWV